VYAFSGVAVLILLIVSLNFVNLATARSVTRTREVAMRKTFGAHRGQLVRQFVGEAVLSFLAATVLALFIAWQALPVFGNLTGLHLGLGDLLEPGVLGAAVTGAVLLGILAGIYPGLYLSAGRVPQLLHSARKSRFSRGAARRLLVVGQSAVTIALIAFAFTVRSQISFMREHDSGYDSRDVVVLRNMTDPSMPPPDLVKEELLSVPGVIAAAASSTVPGSGGMLMTVIPEGYNDNEAQMMTVISVDADFVPTLGMEMVEGRDFSRDTGSDTLQALILNRKATAILGWDDPIGRTIRLKRSTPGGAEFFPGTVVGVVEDFATESLHNPIGPVLLMNSSSGLSTLSLRLRPGAEAETLDLLREKWRELVPDHPLEIVALREELDGLYAGEVTVASMTACFSVLAVAVACLGLLGMSAFAAERRAREACIRKVLGAGVSRILRLLTAETLVLVLLANAIAWPAAYFASREWLSGFAFRIGLPWWSFAAASMLAMVVAMTTVLTQATRVALTNPSQVLRHE
jgi:putative ABC transport system permease protein